MTDYISTKKQWSRKHKFCVGCGSVDNRHISRGLCSSCYNKETNKRSRGDLLTKARGVISSALTKEYLLHEYQVLQKSCADIAKENSCSRQTVYKKLIEYSIKVRDKTSSRNLAVKNNKISFYKCDDNGNSIKVTHAQRFVNESFFDEWSSDMAYVLGFICTDGCLHEKRHSFSISQKECEILVKINLLMESNARIDYIKERKYANTVSGAIYTLDVVNTHIYHRLLDLGLTPSKSLNLKLPNVPSNLSGHFIRGCWDGDGSVYWTSESNIRASFVSSSEAFINKIAGILLNNGITKCNIYRESRNKNHAYYIKINGENCYRLYRFLYNESTEANRLQRKYKIFYDYATKNCFE